MFYLNSDNNDIEGMFREAAENYQLSTEKADDWERIAEALSETDVVESKNIRAVKNKRSWFVFWCLLLIPLGWLGHYAWNNNIENELVKKSASKNFTLNNKEEDAVANDQKKEVKKINAEQQIGTDKNTSLTNNKMPAINKPGIPATDKEFNPGLVAESNIYRENRNDGVIQNIEMNASVIPLKQFQPTPSEKDKQNVIEPGNATTQPVNNSPLNKNPTLKESSSAFYAGFVLSPDITFIKFQKISAVGLSFGLIGGYQVNNHWGLETGFFLDKKNYYTSGEYFDKTNIPALRNVDIKSVDGNCNMFEIPFNVRYRFSSTKKNSNWTASLGTSSYFMRKEYYDYSGVNNGTNVQWDHTYHTNSKNYFAVINLAAGYERNISSTVNIRIEPYYKIPLSGTGTGNLLFSSAGINLGITKKFH